MCCRWLRKNILVIISHVADMLNMNNRNFKEVSLRVPHTEAAWGGGNIFLISNVISLTSLLFVCLCCEAEFLDFLALFFPLSRLTAGTERWSSKVRSRQKGFGPSTLLLKENIPPPSMTLIFSPFYIPPTSTPPPSPGLGEGTV